MICRTCARSEIFLHDAQSAKQINYARENLGIGFDIRAALFSFTLESCHSGIYSNWRFSLLSISVVASSVFR